MVSLIHPRFLSSLAATFYPSSCTIQQPTETQDAYGQPVVTAWPDVAGLANLPCSIAPFSGSPEKAEIKRADGTIEIITHHISIAGHYPTITNKMRAVVDGVAYDIRAVEIDSHATMTRLRTVIVK